MPELKHLVEVAGLTNVQFRPFQPRERLNEVQASCDLAVVSLAPGKGGYSVPSKILGYMAAGRPVVASVDLDSETDSFVRRSGGGLVVEAGNAVELARTIERLSRAPQEREAMGLAGRQFVKKYHSRPAVTASYAVLIESVLKR